jgi:hypothetical protein
MICRFRMCRNEIDHTGRHVSSLGGTVDVIALIVELVARGREACELLARLTIGDVDAACDGIDTEQKTPAISGNRRRRSFQDHRRAAERLLDGVRPPMNSFTDSHLPDERPLSGR